MSIISDLSEQIIDMFENLSQLDAINPDFSKRWDAMTDNDGYLIGINWEEAENLLTDMQVFYFRLVNPV